MSRPIDPYRFVGKYSKKVAIAWSALEPKRTIPWTPLSKPLSQCRVAMITSSAAAMRHDEPFDQQGERDDPWWGDPSHRVIPATATAADVAMYHLHINNSAAEQDLDCVLPLQRLADLAEAGVIGDVAPSHYSFMGYQPRAETLMTRTVPLIIEQLRAEQVDAILLVPV